MHLIPIATGMIREGEDLGKKFCGSEVLRFDGFKENDIVVISSKAIAMSEGRIVDLSKLSVTREAEVYATKCGRSPEFCQAVLEETRVQNGTVVGTCPGAMVTEVRPSLVGSSLVARVTSDEPTSDVIILTANAGLDESNIEKRFAIGWPEDPVESVGRLRRAFEERMEDKGIRTKGEGTGATCPYSLVPSPRLAVVISDSCVRPHRSGVTAFALTVSGIDPIQDQAGKKDLFGKPLRITKEAVADQLATAANMLMGNAGQGIPAVIIRDHGFVLSDFEGWVPGIEPEEDLFRGII